MGTWSCPNTKEKAEKITRLMSKPLPRKFAEDWLYELMGDDELFDAFQECTNDEDVRPLVIGCLKQWLDNLDCFFSPWEPEAIELCQKLITK